MPVGRGISTPLIGGRVFAKGFARHHTVFYLAGLGDRISSLRAFRRARGSEAMSGDHRVEAGAMA